MPGRGVAGAEVDGELDERIDVEILAIGTPADDLRAEPEAGEAPEMLALKAALRAVPLQGGQYYAEDGTLMNADGTRSVFDDVDQ